MSKKRKFLVTDNEQIDLNTYKWDDNLFSNILVEENRIEKDKALGISTMAIAGAAVGAVLGHCIWDYDPPLPVASANTSPKRKREGQTVRNVERRRCAIVALLRLRLGLVLLTG